MDYSQSFAISAAGMTLERTRVDIAALNLANANTIQIQGEGSYRPLRVVAYAVGQVSFGDYISAAAPQSLMGSIPDVRIEPSNTPPRIVYEPDHPSADAKGFVTYAGVDSAAEMVNLMSAMRSYEANVAAMNTGRTLALRALDIGAK